MPSIEGNSSKHSDSAAQNGQSEKRNGRKKRKKMGRPTKQTSTRIQAVLRDRALGLTLEQACAHAGISRDTFAQWEKQNPTLQAKAQAVRIKYLLKQIERAARNKHKHEFRAWCWQLEKCYRAQYGETPKVIINAQQNNWELSDEKARAIEDREQRLALEMRKEKEEKPEQ